MSEFSPEKFLDGLAEAVPEILNETVELPCSLAERGKQGHPIVSEGVTVLVGVLGDVEGYVLLSMSPDFAVRFTSKLIGSELEEYDEIVDSAIGELGNMITGQTSMILHKMGVDCDLCPPTILLSEKVELGGFASEILGARFESEWGEVHARLALGTPSVTDGAGAEPNPAHSRTKVSPTLSKIIRSDQFLDEVSRLLGEGQVEQGLSRAERIDQLGFEVTTRVPVFLVGEAERLSSDLPAEKRRAILEKALALGPDQPSVFLALARLDLEEGALDVALARVTRALALGASSPEDYLLAGEVKHRLGDVEGARSVWTHARDRGAGDRAQALLDSLDS